MTMLQKCQTNGIVAGWDRKYPQLEDRFVEAAAVHTGR